MQVPNKRQKPMEGAPKKAVSAMLLFNQKMRPLLRTQHPQLNSSEILAMLTKQWKAASEDEKRPYLDKEVFEQERFDSEPSVKRKTPAPSSKDHGTSRVSMHSNISTMSSTDMNDDVEDLMLATFHGGFDASCILTSHSSEDSMDMPDSELIIGPEVSHSNFISFPWLPTVSCPMPLPPVPSDPVNMYIVLPTVDQDSN
jgi:hypothetical protein